MVKVEQIVKKDLLSKPKHKVTFMVEFIHAFWSKWCKSVIFEFVHKLFCLLFFNVLLFFNQ